MNLRPKPKDISPAGDNQTGKGEWKNKKKRARERKSSGPGQINPI